MPKKWQEDLIKCMITWKNLSEVAWSTFELCLNKVNKLTFSVVKISDRHAFNDISEELLSELLNVSIITLNEVTFSKAFVYFLIQNVFFLLGDCGKTKVHMEVEMIWWNKRKMLSMMCTIKACFHWSLKM